LKLETGLCTCMTSILPKRDFRCNIALEHKIMINFEFQFSSIKFQG